MYYRCYLTNLFILFSIFDSICRPVMLTTDWIESQLPFDVDALVGEMLNEISGLELDFSAIADRIPDLDNIFDIDSLTQQIRIPFQAAGNLIKTMEFDIFDGVFDKSGIDDVTSFGGLEFRMASTMGGSTLNIDCDTNGDATTPETPFVLNAWYRTLNCYDSNDDFAPKVVRPCGNAKKCTIDPSAYVSPACSPSRTNTGRNNRWSAALELTGASEPNLEWYAMYYTCVTDDQLDEMNFLPSLTSSNGDETLRCSAGEVVNIDQVLWDNPCTDDGIVDGGVAFRTKVRTYCKYTGATRTVIDSNIDLLNNLHSTQLAISNSLSPPYNSYYTKSVCQIPNQYGGCSQYVKTWKTASDYGEDNDGRNGEVSCETSQLAICLPSLFTSLMCTYFTINLDSHLNTPTPPHPTHPFTT